MTLALPVALWLLLALPLILWLHRRRRRTRRVVVPSLIPWQGLLAAVPRRRRQIPPTVLLALHLLAALLLALAAAGPRLPGGDGDGGRAQALVLDVTTSMAAGDRWSAALARADALLADGGRPLTLVTLGPRPAVVVARASDPAVVRAALRGLRPGGTGAATDEALALAAAVAPEGQRIVLSDGAVPRPAADGPTSRWETIGGSFDNVAVLTARARRVGGQLRLFARVARLGAGPDRVVLALWLDGALADERALELPSGGTAETVWTLSGTHETAEVRLAGDAVADPLPADDRAVVPLTPAGPRVQLVGEAPAVARALAAVPGVRLERAGLGTYRADGSVDITVFAGVLPERLPPGGLLLFDPPARAATAAGFAPQTQDAVVRLAAAGDHPLVAGLDLTGVVLRGATDPALPSWARPVLEADGRTVIFAGARPEGHVVAFAFDPAAGTLARRLAFPLLIARAVDWVAPARPPSVVAAGARVPLPPAAHAVRGPDGARWTTSDAFDDTTQPGLYAVEVGRGQAPERFAVQAGEARESDLRAVSAPDAGAGDDDGARTAGQGRPLWPWLIALALGVVTLEAGWRARRSGGATEDSVRRASGGTS